MFWIKPQALFKLLNILGMVTFGMDIDRIPVYCAVISVYVILSLLYSCRTVTNGLFVYANNSISIPIFEEPSDLCI